MPTIDFYYMPESGPCRAVEFVANLVGVSLNKHLLNLFNKDQLKEEFVKLNPLHRVPFIVDGDFKLGESRAIIGYLVDKYGQANSSLYPSDPVRRAKVNELLFFEACTLSVAGDKMLRPVFTGQSKTYDPENEKSFRTALGFAECFLKASNGRFMLDDDLTIADVTLTISLNIADFASYDLSEFKELQSYIKRVQEALPNYHEISDKPLGNLKAIIEAKREKSG